MPKHNLLLAASATVLALAQGAAAQEMLTATKKSRKAILTSINAEYNKVHKNLKDMDK